MDLDTVLSLGPPATRRTERLRLGRFHPDDDFADAFFDLEHPQTRQSQHLLGQPDTGDRISGTSHVVSLRTAATMARSLTSVVDTRSLTPTATPHSFRKTRQTWHVPIG